MFARLFTKRVKVQNKHVCMGLLTIAHCQYYNPAANASQEFDEELVRCCTKNTRGFSSLHHHFDEAHHEQYPG